MDRTERQEYLERVWSIQEYGEDSVQALKAAFGNGFQRSTLDKLHSEGWVTLSEDGQRIVLTEKGQADARQLIRAHRLAERLLCDALGIGEDDAESPACEFEHLVASEMLDGICTMLGHPRECPHGKSIPEGECCKRSLRSLQSQVVPLTELKAGESARIAYVCAEREDQMHRLDGLRIRPGTEIRVHQTYPVCVVECEGGQVALEESIARRINVWANRQIPFRQDSGQDEPIAIRARKRFRFGWGKGR